MTPAERELTRMVWQIVAENPERHNQWTWIGNVFATGSVDGEDFFSILEQFPECLLPVDDIRQYAMEPVPETPETANKLCGTVGCVAGWVAILSAPKGSFLSTARIFLPDGESPDIMDYAQQAMGLTGDQAQWLFSATRSRGEVLAGLDYLPDHPEATYEELTDMLEGV